MRVRHLLPSNTEYTNMLGVITDWSTLGSVLHLDQKLLAWTLHKRNEMQHMVRIGKRITYNSDPPLKRVQYRTNMLVEPLIDQIPNNNYILAYRKGRSYTKEIQRFAGAASLLSFDVKKFYDNILLKHIEETLTDYGINNAGAKLIARYNLVYHEHRKVNALQQGSPAAPAISNLVGYKFIDKPILDWIKTELADVHYSYCRYCDNVELFFWDPQPEGFADRYMEHVTKVLGEGGFKAHDWANVANDDPHRNMKFLGVVLNGKARAERYKLDRLRAILFNMCLHGFRAEAIKYAEKEGIITPRTTEIEKSAIVSKMVPVFRGFVSYINSINERHGLWLKKLFTAAMKAHENGIVPARIMGLREAVLTYKNDSESIDEFVDRYIMYMPIMPIMD